MLKKAMNKSENKILIMLAIFSISMGLWENFRQLWLEDNSFSAINISNILSIGTIVSVVGIMFVGKYIKISKLKDLVTYSLIIKFLNLVLIFYLNNKGLTNLINICMIIDILTGYLVTTSIYPLLTTIVKNNIIYSRRKLTEYLFKDIGILVGGLIIGRNILGVFVNYNMCLLISIVFLIISIIVIVSIPKPVDIDNKKTNSIIKYIAKSKIQRVYIIYTFIGAAAMSTALGLKMLMLTNYFKFTDTQAINYLLIVGLLSDIVGILALKYFTPKNDYITITIKFGIRFTAYLIAFISNNITISIIATTWSILISTSYENICDGYYINMIPNKYQLTFTNFRYAIRYLGEASGIFLCGLMYKLGLRYMFGLSSLILFFQITLAYYLIYLRKTKSIKNLSTEKEKVNLEELNEQPIET